MEEFEMKKLYVLLVVVLSIGLVFGASSLFAGGKEKEPEKVEEPVLGFRLSMALLKALVVRSMPIANRGKAPVLKYYYLLLKEEWKK